MSQREPNPWDRAKGESAKAYSYFLAYLQMPSHARSHAAVGGKYNCSENNVARFSSKWRWTERVDAYDRHEEELNFAHFEKMRERAVRRRLERELLRQDAASEIADQMLERGRQMLAWPIEEVKDVTKSTITPDGQTITQITRIIKPVKWDLNALARFIETMDKIARSSVIEATKERESAGIPPGDIAERHFTLHTAEQVQMPQVPEQTTTETPKDGDWVVGAGEEGVQEPLETRIP